MSDTNPSVTQSTVTTDPPPNPSTTTNPPPPPSTSTAASFDPTKFMSDLDTKMAAWSEKVTDSVREAFPTPPAPTDPPKSDPPPATDPPKSDPPKSEDPPKPGKKTFAEWWFGS